MTADTKQLEEALIDVIQHLDNTTPALQARFDKLCALLRTKSIPTTDEAKNQVWVLLGLIVGLEYPRLMTEVNREQISRFADRMSLYTQEMPNPRTLPDYQVPPNVKDR